MQNQWLLKLHDACSPACILRRLTRLIWSDVAVVSCSCFMWHTRYADFPELQLLAFRCPKDRFPHFYWARSLKALNLFKGYIFNIDVFQFNIAVISLRESLPSWQDAVSVTFMELKIAQDILLQTSANWIDRDLYSKGWNMVQGWHMVAPLLLVYTVVLHVVAAFAPCMAGRKPILKAQNCAQRIEAATTTRSQVSQFALEIMSGQCPFKNACFEGKCSYSLQVRSLICCCKKPVRLIFTSPVGTQK